MVLTLPDLAADLLNDRVLPMFETHGIDLLRILTDRGTEFCARPERHDYQLYLAVSVLNIGTPRNCWAFLLQPCLASHSFYGKIEERISLCFGAEMAQDRR